MSQKEVQNEPCGVLIIDKPDGMTSHDVVGKVRRLFNTRRVGHTGTLDPMATGVLTVLIGRAAKAAEYLVSDRKTYLATLRLGLTTDTEDTTGEILTQTENIPDEATVMAVLPRFRRTGLGKKLMEAMLAKACELGLETMFLEVRESNAPAIGLYRSFGFEQVGRRPNYYTMPTEAAVLFSAELKK